MRAGGTRGSGADRLSRRVRTPSPAAQAARISSAACTGPVAEADVGRGAVGEGDLVDPRWLTRPCRAMIRRAARSGRRRRRRPSASRAPWGGRSRRRAARRARRAARAPSCAGRWRSTTGRPARRRLRGSRWRVMSGKAVSKQTIGPIRRPSPTFITICRAPRLRSSPAALPTEVAQPSSGAGRDVLAERDEPHLVVAVAGRAVRADQDRALVDAGLVGAPGVHVDQDVRRPSRGTGPRAAGRGRAGPRGRSRRCSRPRRSGRASCPASRRVSCSSRSNRRSGPCRRR